jgi:hypothetical protein
MARRSVQCSCGADFFVPEVPPSTLHCPRCGDPVRLQKGDGGANRVREELREPVQPLPPRKPYYPLILLASGGLMVAAGLVILVVLFSTREVKRDPAMSEEVRPKPRPKAFEPLISIKDIPPTPESPKPEPPKSPLPGFTPPAPFDAASALARAQKLIARSNLTGLVSTLLFLDNRIQEHQELQVALTKHQAEIRQLTESLKDRNEVTTLRDYFQSGDVMTVFVANVLDPAHPKPFAAGIRDWLSTAQAGAAALATVQRGGRPLLLSMWFSEIDPELLAAASVVQARTGPRPLSDAAAEAQRKLAVLHPYYRKSLPLADAARLENLIKEGRGTPEDEEFLRNRIPAYCARSESELVGFSKKVSELEAAIASAPAADAVIFKDGRKVLGHLEEETGDVVQVKGKFGAVKVSKADVLRIEYGDALGAEFRRRYDVTRGKPEELPSLLAWCKDKNLAQQMELSAYAILKSDPGNDAAWTALGVADHAAEPTGPEFDVVWLHDGTKREGIITGESDTVVKLDVVVRGAKAEMIGAGKATIARADIARVERMNAAARKRAQERALSFGSRVAKMQEAVARITLAPDSIHGMAGYRASGTLFELHSTCAPPLVRETAYTLEEMFNAYRKHFSVRRNPARRIDVYFLANEADYVKFQEDTRGSVGLAPAYFNTAANHIAAFYGVQKAEEARVRAAIVQSERDIEKFKKDVAAEEDRIAKEVRGLRQKVLEEAKEARKQNPGDGKVQASIDRWKKESLDNIKTQEQAGMDQLGRFRQQANQAIANLEEVIRFNQGVLGNQTRSMYEILFHEAFHAFAANFLWEETDNAGLPRWLHEGMATYFERSVVEGGELVQGASHPIFLALLRQEQHDGQMIPLPTLVAAGPDMFQIQHTGEIPRQEAAYAHAWGLAHYLISKGMTRDRLEAYVTDASNPKSRVSAFEKLAGKRISEVEADWRAHLSSLK